MPLHMHTERSYCGAALGVVLAVSLLGAVSSSPSGEPERALVTGRATCGGHPLRSMWIVFEKIGPRGCNTASPVMADGSFRLEPRRGSGLPPGVYRIRFARRGRGVVEPSPDPKYMDPRTSGLEAYVGPGWNDIVISLPRPDPGPTVDRPYQGEDP